MAVRIRKFLIISLTVMLVLSSCNFAQCMQDDSAGSFFTDWKSGQVEMFGKIYTLPIKVNDFLNDGWKPDGFRADETAGSTGSLGTGHFYTVNARGVFYFNSDIANLSDESGISLGECYLTSIEVDDRNFGIILPKNIRVGVSTAEDVISAWGQPTAAEGDSLYYMFYEGCSYRLDFCGTLWGFELAVPCGTV